MWNDEEPREAEPGLRQIVSSWALVAAILAGFVGWSALQYAAQIVGPILTKERSSALTAVVSCHASAEQIPSEVESVREHQTSSDDAPRPSAPKTSHCQDSSPDPVGLPGAAMALGWEALR